MRSAHWTLPAAVLLAMGALAGPAATVAVAGTGSGGGANALTTQYPLGQQKLCCRSRSSGAASSSSSPAAAPARSSAAGSRTSHAQGAAFPVSTVAAAALVAGLLLAAAGYRRAPATWRGPRAYPRPRRRVAWWMIVLLWPMMRYSTSRQAYVLRRVGQHLGPVLTAEPRHSGRSSQAATSTGPEQPTATPSRRVNQREPSERPH